MDENPANRTGSKSVEDPFASMFRVGTIFKVAKPRKVAPDAEQEYVFGGLIKKETYEVFRAAAGLLFEGFKVFMATLLSIFVPQDCGGHSCSVQENFGTEGSALTGWNTYVLAWNFITLGFAFVHYYLVYKREKFLIEYLDEDNTQPELNLPKVISRYPEIDKALFKWNLFVLISSIWVISLFIVNAIVSGVLVFRDWYDGYRTVTVFLTNIALMGSILERTLWHSYAGIQKRLALSCIDWDARSFNVIDVAYRDQNKETIMPDIAEDAENVDGGASFQNRPSGADGGYGASPVAMSAVNGQPGANVYDGGQSALYDQPQSRAGQYGGPSQSLQPVNRPSAGGDSFNIPIDAEN